MPFCGFTVHVPTGDDEASNSCGAFTCASKHLCVVTESSECSAWWRRCRPSHLLYFPVVAQLLSGDPGPVSGSLSADRCPPLSADVASDSLSPAWTSALTCGRTYDLPSTQLTGTSHLNQSKHSSACEPYPSSILFTTFAADTLDQATTIFLDTASNCHSMTVQRPPDRWPCFQAPRLLSTESHIF